MARLTGLEPATPGVTGRYSNQLSYNRAMANRFDPLAISLLAGAGKVKRRMRQRDEKIDPRKVMQIQIRPMWVSTREFRLMNDVSKPKTLTCHCGGVVLSLDLPDGIVDPRRCDCSICSRRGTIVASVPLSGLRVMRGEGVLRSYRFGTMTAEHWFCGTCGIQTHHRRRSNPEEYGFNLACLDGIDIREWQDVPLRDGVTHPKDR